MNNVTNVLFLCPHAAAKSVLAMTYFTDLAAKANLAVDVSNAGTEPDPSVHPLVAAHLKEEGVDLTEFVPPLLTKSDLESADIVVSIGCISAEQVPAGSRFLDWSDVPMISDGFEPANARIREHVVKLVEELSDL